MTLLPFNPNPARLCPAQAVASVMVKAAAQGAGLFEGAPPGVPVSRG